MSDREAEQLANCPHAMPIPCEAALRCPHCGAVQIEDGPWCFPHLVKAFVDAWKKTPQASWANPDPGALAEDQQPKLLDRHSRLLQRFQVGQLVRAAVDVYYGTGEEVAEGTRGRVQQIDAYGCSPLVMVAWDGRGGEGQPPQITHPCSVENLEPVVS